MFLLHVPFYAHQLGAYKLFCPKKKKKCVIGIPHCTTDFPPQCSDHPATLFLHPSLYSSSLTSSSRILVWTVGHFFFSLGQKVEAKLGFDVILINGTFKTASRLFFSPPSTADKRALTNHVQVKIDLHLLMYFYKRHRNTYLFCGQSSNSC